jgi:hypothetical protein
MTSQSATLLMRRKFPAWLRLVAVLTFMQCSGCAAASSGVHTVALAQRPAPINHIVQFKLKNPADAAELIADCDRDLAIVPGVVSYFAGTPLKSDRPGVDQSFDVCFYAGFNSVEDYNRYLEHPNHRAAVTKWKPRWDSIRITDIVDPTP